MVMSLGPLLKYLRIKKNGNDRFYDCLITGCDAREMPRKVIWRHFKGYHLKIYDAARNQMIRKMPQPRATGEKPFKGIRGRREELVRFYNTALEHTIELEMEA